MGLEVENVCHPTAGRYRQIITPRGLYARQGRTSTLGVFTDTWVFQGKQNGLLRGEPQAGLVKK